MSTLTDQVANAYNDFNMAGVPNSGAKDPLKSDIRSLLLGVLAAIDSITVTAAISSGAVVMYANAAAMNADLSRVAGTLGIVTDDATDTNNGIYSKVGSTGTGSWSNTGLVTMSSIRSEIDTVVSGYAAVNAQVAAAMASATAASASANTSASEAAIATSAASDTSNLFSTATLFAGITKVYATYALALADVSSIAANAYISVMADETEGWRRTIYQKQSGSLVFITFIDQGQKIFIALATAGESGMRAAATAALAAGGGTVLLPDATITLTASAVMGNYLTYAGVRPRMTYGVIPDNPWTFTGGTVLQGDGTFPCFSANSATVSAPSPGSATMNTALKGFRLRDIGLQTFSRAVDIGGTNNLGVMYGAIENLWIRNCSDWAFHMVNSMHTPVRNVWISQDTGYGHGFRLAADLPTSVVIPGNMSVDGLYVYQGSTLKKGIVVQGVNGGSLNEVMFGSGARVQCNRFGAVGSVSSQAATMTNGSSLISVPNASLYAVELPVTLSASVNGFTANQVYVVLAVDTVGNTITLGTSKSASAISATGNTAVNILCGGMPNLELGGVGTNNLQQSRFHGLDIEGHATTSLYVENANNCAIDIDEVGSTTTHVTLRSSKYNEITSWKEYYHDIDGNSYASMFRGSIKGINQNRGLGLGYNFTDDRLAINFISASAPTDDLAALFLSGGSGVQANRTVTKHVQSSAVGGVLNLDFGRSGIGYVTFGGTNTLTLPTITNASPKTSWIGVPFELVAVGTAPVTINTDGTQVFNGIAGKTSVVIPSGGSVQIVAGYGNGGALSWYILGGKDVDVIKASATSAPPSISSGAQYSTTVTTTGAALGNMVQLSLSIDQGGLILHGYVSSANTVTIIYANMTGSPVALASHTVNVKVKQ